MQELAALVPQLQQNAWDRYESQGQALLDQYKLLQGQDASAYDQWRDQVEDWQNASRQARDRYESLEKQDYSNYLALMKYYASRAKQEQDAALAQQKLESALDRPLAMEQVAAELGMSLTNLNRIFRQELHTSPLKYRNTCRIELARELLQHSTLSIKEIAAKAGYCNQFYFTQEFRRCTAQTPTEFRREYRAAVPQSIHQ